MLLSLLTGSTPPSPHIPLPPKDPPAIVQKAEVKHKIIKGDTLTKIAKDNNTTVERLFDKNTQISDPDVLIIGIEITIPEPSEKLKPRIPPVEAKNASQPIKSSPNQPSTGLNGYYAGECTGYVASRRYVPPGWGNASDWKYNAQRAGWTVSSTPVAGAIGWRSGHVVYVESVNPDGSVTISEQNYDWNSSIRTITISPSQYQYLY